LPTSAWGLLESRRVQAFREPHLDDGLPGNTRPASLLIQPLDHPRREIDIDAILCLAGTPGFGQVLICIRY